MEKISSLTANSLTTICPLCQREIPITDHQAHLAMHERAEMLADILALSRR